MKVQTQEKPHLSYSQVNTYLSCPVKYRFHYIDQIEPPFVSAALAFGSCIHDTVAAFHQSCLEGDPLTSSQLVDVYTQVWSSHSDQRPVRFFNGDSEEKLAAKAQRMLEVFRDAFHLEAQSIIGIEEPFEIDLGKRMPPLVGWIDAIECAPDGTVSIVDLKTAARKYSERTVHSNLQLTCYSLGAQAMGFNGDLRLRLDVLLKTESPELIRYETARTDEDRTRFLKLVKSVWQGVKKQVFFPKQDWHCSQCGFAEECQKW